MYGLDAIPGVKTGQRKERRVGNHCRQESKSQCYCYEYQSREGASEEVVVLSQSIRAGWLKIWEVQNKQVHGTARLYVGAVQKVCIGSH